jgi:hypothetical protein
MKHMLRFRIAVACYSCYVCGEFLGSLFMYQNNRIAAIAAVAIPTLLLFLYISIISRQVQPRKKKLPARRNVRLVR